MQIYYMYDLGLDGIYGTSDDVGEVQITSDLGYDKKPDIYEDKIVWVRDNKIIYLSSYECS